MFLQPKLGLTLSGGGARGGAHLGVLHVLDEVGYKPDIIVGTSVGGLIAALLGIGWATDRIYSFCSTIKFTDLIYPDRTGSGLLGIERAAELLRSQFGDADLRDLSPKIAVVSVDLRSCQRVLIDRGPVVKAMLATMAVPGLFSPVEWNGYLLVDGGIVDNIPTQATYQLGAERIVAVDVGTSAVDVGLTLGEAGTFGRQLQRALYWLLGLAKRQSVFDTWIQAQMYSYRMLDEYHLALFPPDVLIRPDIPDGIGIFSFERLPEAIEAGERTAREMKSVIRKAMKHLIPPHREHPYNMPPLINITQNGYPAHHMIQWRKSEK